MKLRMYLPLAIFLSVGIAICSASLIPSFATNKYSFIQSGKGTPVPAFLQNLVGTQFKDPVFYVLTTKTGRKVYILGVIHTIHPEILLSKDVFNLLKGLAGQAILFTEHESMIEYILKKDRPTKDNSLAAELDLTKLYKDPETNKIWVTLWTLIKNKSLVLGNSFKLEDIMKLSPNDGALLFYMYASREREGIAPGFEVTLEQWQWRGKIQFLETPKVALDNTQIKDVPAFFREGGMHLRETLKYQKREQRVKLQLERDILHKYKTGVRQYRYDNYQTGNSPAPVRNKSWSDEFLKNLSTYPKATPILIVCGAAHLIGGISKGSSSFLEYLSKSPQINSNSIQRIDKDGKPKNIDNSGKK